MQFSFNLPQWVSPKPPTSAAAAELWTKSSSCVGRFDFRTLASHHKGNLVQDSCADVLRALRGQLPAHIKEPDISSGSLIRVYWLFLAPGSTHKRKLGIRTLNCGKLRKTHLCGFALVFPEQIKLSIYNFIRHIESGGGSFFKANEMRNRVVK